MRDAKEEHDSLSQIRLYFYVVLILLGLALISFLFVPSGKSVTLAACERIVLEQSKNSCISNLALSTSNASMCGHISGSYADSCYMSVAEKTETGSVCGKIVANASRNECIESVAVKSGNYTSCSKASEPYASRCYESLAVKLDTPSVCLLAKYERTQVECTSIIGLDDAIRTGNAGDCLRVSDSLDKNLTGGIIANFSLAQGFSANSLNVSSYSFGSLAQIPNLTFTARDYCYTTLAAKTHTPALCDNVSAGEGQLICNGQAGGFTPNSTVNYTQELASCASSGQYAQLCKESVILAEAITKRNATLCGTLQGNLTNSCYTALATTYNDSSYCNYISDPTTQSNCLSRS